MDPIRNPFAPGAGTPPPELAGRDAIRKVASIAIERVRQGRAAQGIILTGLRGVGKTVLLNRILGVASQTPIHTVSVEIEEHRSLPALLAPELRLALLELSRSESAKAAAQRGLRALAGWMSALKFKYADIEVAIDCEPEKGLADNGDLQQDLLDLLLTCGEAAQKANSAVALFIDELQYVPEASLAPLITALHRMNQRQLPVILIGAGLPSLPGQFSDAKSYAERMFVFERIGALDEEAARQALERPIRAEGAEIEDEAVELILAKTHRYAYFLQEWGRHAWDISIGPIITTQDVQACSLSALAALDNSFFRVRFDRLTTAEREYLRAMADLGPGPHRSGDIASSLGKTVQAQGGVRTALIRKGMLWAPSHGETAFTVPLFDEFMPREMAR